MKKVLIIVDPQNDFITGSLAVPGAEDAMRKFGVWAKGNLEKFDFIAVTIDSHPNNHCSFIEQGGVFPSHCVNHTEGASISKTVEAALKFGKNVKFYTKGENSKKEEFSIFETYYNGYKLLNDFGVTNRSQEFEIHVMGIAGDYCVHDTIAGLIKMGYKKNIVVLPEFIASLDGGKKLQKLIDDNELQTL
jgi:nicotinamidase/pyrazinamidase